MLVDQKNMKKHCKSKRHIYIIDLKRNQVTECKLREVLEKYGEVKGISKRQDSPRRKGNMGMVCLATEEQGKLALKMLEIT